MADYVRIHKGAHELSVSRKAFNSIYKEKGFELVDGGSEGAGPKKTATKSAKGKGKTDSDTGDKEATS
jgi:hypothetical protein